jgi:hypothetical protein
LQILRSQESSVGIATSYSKDRRIEVRFPVVARDFSHLHSIQIGSGDHSASYPLDKVKVKLSLGLIN